MFKRFDLTVLRFFSLVSTIVKASSNSPSFAYSRPFIRSDVSNVPFRHSKSRTIKQPSNGLTSPSPHTTTIPLRAAPTESKALDGIERIADFVLNGETRSSPSHSIDDNDLSRLPPSLRESLGVANHLQTRIRSFRKNNDCPRCWLQRAHCVCAQTPSIEEAPDPFSIVRRVFVLTHHKEICMAVDTAKLILSSFPTKARLVVSGLGSAYQPSMSEMEEALRDKKKCIVLFPDEDAVTFEEWKEGEADETRRVEEGGVDVGAEGGYDVIVIDGTWSQARKMHRRYIPAESDGGPKRIRLSDEALDEIVRDSKKCDNPGTATEGDKENETHSLQLRRHPIKWREVSTLAATRLLLKDMVTDCGGRDVNDALASLEALGAYQKVADDAARRQLGPPRLSPRWKKS